MKLSARKFAGILASLLLLVWLAASAALFLFIKYRKGYEEIALSEVVLPWNWDELRPKWGDYFIEKGIQHKEAGEWDQAFYFVRVGVSKSPANISGRLSLADMLFQANEIGLAVGTLEAGLAHAGQEEKFWEKMIRFLQYYQADREIIRILNRGLKDQLVPKSQMETTQTALANAYYHQAQFDSALEAIKSSSTITNQLLRSKIYWEQGLESLAIQKLESLNLTFPNHREIVPELTNFYQRFGEFAKARNLARVTYLNNPYSVGASVNYFRTLQEDALSEIDRFLARVPEILENEDALIVLANYLSESGYHQKLTKIIQQSGTSFKESPMVWFLEVEALVNAREFKLAESRLENAPEYINQLIPLHRILFHSLSMTAYYGMGASDKGKTSMQQLFVSGHIRPATLLRLSSKLIELNRPEEARNALEFLLRQNPGNHAAFASRIRIEILNGETKRAISLSQVMLENKTMPFALTKELIKYLSLDHQIYDTQGPRLIEQILANMSPSKKKQLLEVL